LLVNGYFWNELKSRIFIEVDDLWRKKAVGKVRAGHLTDGRHDPCIFSVPPSSPEGGIPDHPPQKRQVPRQPLTGLSCPLLRYANGAPVFRAVMPPAIRA
jgi:hypothetical protein